VPAEPSSGPLSGRITAASVADLVADRIAEAIRDGTLAAGERLPSEAHLAGSFAVGRTSIREGLQKLRALGLIETRKGLGAFVLAPDDRLAGGDASLAAFARWATGDPASIVELLEARIGIETLAAALAAVRATPTERSELRRLAGIAVADGDPVDRLMAWDEAFHAAILRSSGNPFLRRLYDALVAELASFRRQTLALPWAATRSSRDHQAIAAAIAAGDPSAARQAMADHLWALYADIVETAGSTAPSFKPAPRRALR
jgi:DNA-binding FadR family transcriptional regulator